MKRVLKNVTWDKVAEIEMKQKTEGYVVKSCVLRTTVECTIIYLLKIIHILSCIKCSKDLLQVVPAS